MLKRRAKTDWTSEGDSNAIFFIGMHRPGITKIESSVWKTMKAAYAAMMNHTRRL